MLDGQPVGHRNRNMPFALPPAAAARRQAATGNCGGSGSVPPVDLQPLFLPKNGTGQQDSGSEAVIDTRGLTPQEQAAVTALQQLVNHDSHIARDNQVASGPSAGASDAQLRADALERLIGPPAAAGSQDSNGADAAGDEQEHAADSAADGNASDSGAWTPAAWQPPAQHQQRRQQRKPRSSSMSVRPAALQLGAAELLVRPILGAVCKASCNIPTEHAATDMQLHMCASFL
jgi:hypothetical protein